MTHACVLRELRKDPLIYPIKTHSILTLPSNPSPGTPGKIQFRDRKPQKKMIRPQKTRPTPMDVSCVMFDMDGTLLDSAAGVTSSAAHALASVAAPIPPRQDLLLFVGPPMIESF